MEFLEGGHVIDGVSNSDVVVDDTFCLALNECGDVDGGGARGADDGEGVQQSGFEGVPVVDINPSGEVDTASVGEGRTSQGVEDVGHGTGVGPSGRVFGTLDPGDPLFASEDIGFISTEERKLGEVGLPEVFSVIGHFKF